MEKRFTLFIILAALVLLTNFWIQAKFFPPKPRDKNAIVKKDDKNKPLNGLKEDPEKKNGEISAPDKSKTDPEKLDTNPEVPAVRKSTEAKPALVTLGSVDPSTGYPFLVTFSNLGATVERIELSSQRYHELDDAHGYLGHLGLEMAGNGNGVIVNVVGAGTPAINAKDADGKEPAGLQVGDVISEVNGQPVSHPVMVNNLLKKTKPGDTLKLKVERGTSILNFTTTLGKRPLEIVRPEPDKPPRAPYSFGLTLESIGSGKSVVAIPIGEKEIPKLQPSMYDYHWELSKATKEEVEFRFVYDEADLKQIGVVGELEILKRFKLLPTPEGKTGQPRYHIDFEVEIKSNAKDLLQVAYRLDGPNGLPLEGWWYSTKISPYMTGGAGPRDVVWEDKMQREFLSGPKILANAQKKPNAPENVMFSEDQPIDKRTIKYIGLDTQYFVAALIPKGNDQSGDERTPYSFRRSSAFPLTDLATIQKGYEKKFNLTFQLSSESKTISPDKPLKQSFDIFAGPKEPGLLASYGLQDTIELGWWYYVTKTMSMILQGFWMISRNYGIAIIMLTVLVRCCMLPISYKMTKNAQKMQALAPEVKKLAETYKDDLEKRSRAQQELFAKHGVNMYSGCLLVFFQLPIFAGLYRLLAVDINLRQAPLIPGLEWCSNLAGPDKFWNWSQYAPAMLSDETGWFGPYLNILPLITVALFIINQKMMTPPATDEQSKMQQQIMSFMMIFFAAMFFKVPSGLCIYFIASSLWTLAEHKVLRKNQAATLATGGSGGGTITVTPKKTPPSNGNDRRKEARKKNKR